MRIAVTGSSGKLGSATVERLRADGHEVLGLDVVGLAGPGFTRVQLDDYGQTLDALLGVTARHTGLDALVHLAAIPVNGLVPDAATFHNNMAVSFNVLFGAHASLAVLPLMLFHQMQLMVCAVIARRRARDPEAGPTPPAQAAPSRTAVGTGPRRR